MSNSEPLLPSVPNFRDLGGLRTREGRSVKPGLLYRSDMIVAVDPEDETRLRDEIGVRELIDLRSTPEHRRFHAGEVARPPLRLHHLPVIDGEPHQEERDALRRSLADTYVALAKHRADSFARVLRALSRFEQPTVFFCAAGKDRTGMVAALVLGILGVDDDTIVEDYYVTQQRLAHVMQRLARLKGLQFVPSQLQDESLSAQPQTMRRFLDDTNARHGGLRGYVDHLGVEAETITRLRERLLE